jgi:hypothetical protein
MEIGAKFKMKFTYDFVIINLVELTNLSSAIYKNIIGAFFLK